MALSKACRQSWDLNRHLPMQQKQWVQRPWGIELLRGGLPQCLVWDPQ